MPEWSLQLFNAMTGAPAGRLPMSTASNWSTGITGTQSSTETFLVKDDVSLAGRVDSLFAGNKHLLARTWGNHVAYAQKIEAWDYDRDAGKITVNLVELRNEAEWRLIGGVSTPKTGTFTITGRSASGAMRAALQRMMNWGPAWEFPIDLPADGSGTFTRSWRFWEKQRISDILEQIESIRDVELYLRPYLDGGMLRFEAIVQPQIQIGLTEFKLHADESPLGGVKYRKDFTRQVTGLLGVGNGSGQDQEIAWAGQDTHPIIIRDTQESIPDLKGAELQAATTNRFNARRQPTVQWTVGSFTASDMWDMSLASPGRLWRLESRDDPVIPDGEHTVRVVSVSGGNGVQVRVEVQDAAA